VASTANLVREKARKGLAQLPLLWRALGLVWEAAPRLTIAWGVLTVVLGLLPVVSVFLTRALVDSLVGALGAGAGWERARGPLLLAAAAAGVLVPVLRDLLDRRVRTVNDAHKLVGIAPAGWQVERADTASQVFGDEQLRRMAAALIRSRDARGQRVFGFTGCKPGAGTTSLVLELAGSLRTLGYKVLAVEANGYSRDARYASDRPGLAERLAGRAGADEVVAEATPALPARVAVDGRPAAGRVAIENLAHLPAALAQWADAMDFVLVDLPPLLVSADAELLVRSVGQVLLVVQADAVTQGEVKRAARLLHTLDPAAVGLVVNRIQPFRGGGYLRDLMIESVSGRALGAVFTLPRWRLAWASLFVRRSKSRA
jgi:Mrp family chromosome partitioning ATPase